MILLPVVMEIPKGADAESESESYSSRDLRNLGFKEAVQDGELQCIFTDSLY
jgi:hypothetical protein